MLGDDGKYNPADDDNDAHDDGYCDDSHDDNRLITNPLHTQLGYHIVFYGVSYQNRWIFRTNPAAKRQKRD